jgi:MFS family permease
VSLPFGPVCGDLADRFGPRPVLVGSNIARLIGFVTFLGVHNFPELLLASLAVQLGNRAFYSAQAPLITQLAPPGSASGGSASSARCATPALPWAASSPAWR